MIFGNTSAGGTRHGSTHYFSTYILRVPSFSQGGSSQNKERPSNQADPTDSSLSGMLTRILNRLFSLLPWSATGEKPAECVFCRIARGN